MTGVEKDYIGLGKALYKIQDATKVASDLDKISYALIDAVNMPMSTTSFRTIVKALAIQVGEAAAKVEDIRQLADEALAMPEAEQEKS